MEEHKRLMLMDLQFFAKDGPGGEKTEEPTEKKLSDSRKEGQVAKGKELSNAVSLIALFLVLQFGTAKLGNQLLTIFTIVYNRIPDYVKLIGGDVSSKDFTLLIFQILIKILVMLLPIFCIGVVVAFVIDLIQVKWRPTSKPLQPKFSKMNPLSGVKRLFSKDKIMDLLMSVAKIGIISYVVYSTLKDKSGLLFLLYDIPLTQAIITIGDIAISLGLKISYIYFVLALIDYAYQKWKFHEDMKMTKQEVKDEWKNSEGNPEVKNKIKQKMREISQRRMMASIPEADVIITNPTHYAVALKYDKEVADAPIVTAKGQDFLAQRIKDAARENHVEIVENKPLARMLYHNVEIGGLVPPELYQAVAEVLAFVYNLKKTG